MSELQPPPHAEVSCSGYTWLDDSGIIIAVGETHSIHTLEHALENHAINFKVAAGIPRPFLIDITKVKAMSREAREFYAGPEPAKFLTAVAIVTRSNIGKIVANFFIGLTKPRLPTRMFTDHAEAMQWLTPYIQNEAAAK